MFIVEKYSIKLGNPLGGVLNSSISCLWLSVTMVKIMLRCLRLCVSIKRVYLWS